MQNNFIKTVDLPCQFSSRKAVSITFILDGKLHSIKYLDDKIYRVSICNVLTKQEEAIFENRGIYCDESEFAYLRPIILENL